MNIPFQSIHFMTYEIGQNLTNKEKTYNPRAHIISGALAGNYIKTKVSFGMENRS